jgi:hypothetical protein
MTTQLIGWACVLSSLIAAALAIARNRNAVAWFMLGALFPVLSIAMLTILDSLGSDGEPIARCCPHCPHHSRGKEIA